jgi:hypothetical protein
MTGAYLRVKRDGKWQNLEVEHLTDEEREELLKNDPRLIQWLNLACHKLVETETILRELEADGILERRV